MKTLIIILTVLAICQQSEGSWVKNILKKVEGFLEDKVLGGGTHD